ncbi:hypothetical protein HYS10_00735 [Candidatus Collierbacteria bacterium]|nr:hypothetical protein [Candidatus Collierbacteria bacterium]
MNEKLDKKPPLYITFFIQENGLSFGWGLNRNQIYPRLPICTKDTLDLWVSRGRTTEEIAHTEALKYFNGSLSADLNIPAGYPYEFFIQGEEASRFSGTLRQP